jgi:fumarate hydratase class II
MSKAISKASEEVMQGKHDRRVVVDVFQTGSGTGINMNLNELIAERASRILRRNFHPNYHVNLGQSSNDVGPTAIRIAAVSLTQERLNPGLEKFSQDLERLARRTSKVYKAGRTHLRDAMPVTMGQEFGAFADAFSHDLSLVEQATDYVRELPIGGTAVGTGINTHPKFGKLMVDEISAATKLDFFRAKNKFRAIRLLTDLIALSSTLRVVAIDLYRLCQDLRLMFSGPITALGEIDIPTQEEVAGSSIMPGKVIPVTLEAAMQVSAQIIGLDQSNLMAGTLGEFEMSMGVPVIGYNTVTQLNLLSETLGKLSSLVIRHVVPNAQRARKYAESSPALITVISPQIGYDKAAQIGKELVRGYSIREAMRELGYKEAEINKILDLKKLVRPGRISGKRNPA